MSLAPQFDFILIDGRRPLECAFVASPPCHRIPWSPARSPPQANQPVRALFEILEEDSQFRIMRPRHIFQMDERGMTDKQ
jgi:hypothetical protein